MAMNLIGFVDGENLVFRYQDMLADGAKPAKEVVHTIDTFVWHPAITNQYYADITRISYYQTVVGDQNKVDQVKGQISQIRYEYSESEKMDGFGFLQPRVFKKDKKISKTKSVDINLTVDMLRHALSGSFDVLLLLSGDGDYLPLVEEVARHGKQVWIGAFSKGLNTNLRFAADQFIDLDEIVFTKKANTTVNRTQRNLVAPQK